MPADLQPSPETEQDVDGPDSRVWRRSDGALIPFPGGRTRAEWTVIGEASMRANAHLPDD